MGGGPKKIFRLEIILERFEKSTGAKLGVPAIALRAGAVSMC